MYLNTLGVVQYRLQRYEDAIKSLTKSLELTPSEMNLPGPHACDLAFLAMSHHKLGHVDEATAFRQQLTEAMQHKRFANDAECLGFVEEVNALFDGSSDVAPAPEVEATTPEPETVTDPN